MNMLIRPAPFPEELDRGYLGRVMRINGYLNEKDVVTAIAESLGAGDKTRREFTMHELLSQVAGLTSEQFAQSHTTVPLRRAITSFFPEVRHGSLDRRSLLHHSAIQKRYPAAYFCPSCVEADIAFHGVSYWRRDHLTPGQLWCPKHQTALHYVSYGDLFLSPPVSFVDRAHEIPADWIEEAKSNEYVQRFLALATELFDQHTPFSVATIAPMLRDLGKAQGFQTYAGPVKAPLISDRIRAVFPERWLGMVFHDLLEKPHGQFLFQIDGALYMRKSSSSVTAYLLVLAVLFPSADAALNSLCAVRDGTHRPQPMRTREESLVLPDEDTLMALYVQEKGSHAAIAGALKLSRFRIAGKLESLGLPNLAGRQAEDWVAALGALEAFYVRKKTLPECLPAAGMSLRQFEALVRKCGPNMTRLLSKMAPSTGGRARGRKAKSMLPVSQDPKVTLGVLNERAVAI